MDAGGGNGILGILKYMKVPVERMHHAFLSHRHTDHMLGMVWVIRLIGTMMTQDRYEGTFTVYCHRELAADLECLVRMTLDKGLCAWSGNASSWFRWKMERKWTPDRTG